ncbi:MAG: hypothetical protein LBF71_03220 [Campylobacteraceae bacterium]|jgi:hypothetical protein|nr:hypothetical protein [Campylobacteraceae bacterium]
MYDETFKLLGILASNQAVVLDSHYLNKEVLEDFHLLEKAGFLESFRFPLGDKTLELWLPAIERKQYENA